MDSLIERVEAALAAMAGPVLLGVGIFLASWFAGILLEKLIRRVGARYGERLDEGRRTVFVLLGQIVRTGMIIVGIVSALGTFGVDVSAVVAGLGLTGFALGFAFRDILSNVLAGILLFMYQPFRLRDRIAVMSFEGVVVGMDLRYTTLQVETKRVLIPNSMLFTNPISVIEPARPATSS